MGRKDKRGKDRIDKYYNIAKDLGYRARSAFKLIQLAKSIDFLSKSRVCIDLCAAPGSWSQVCQRNMPAESKIIAVDLFPIKPIPGVTTIASDITTDKCRNMIRQELAGDKADVVLHDGAPNVGASWAKDAYSQAELTIHATRVAAEHLRIGGTYVTKVFRSSEYTQVLWVLHQLFNKVDATKPTASRNVSAEIFVHCRGFKGGRIDPRFFEPKWVFMDNLDPDADKPDKPEKKPTSVLKDLIKQQPKRHRTGYEVGDDNRVIAAHLFIESMEPAKALVSNYAIVLEAEGSEEIASNPLTTDEIRELVKDLRVLGKGDLSRLLKWRLKLIQERERHERAVQKEEEEKEKAEAEQKAAVALAIRRGHTTDAAIAAFLEARGEDDVDSEKEEEEEIALMEQIAVLNEQELRQKKREDKKLLEKRKKDELRMKMNMGSKTHDSDPLLFHSSKRARDILLEDPRSFEDILSDSPDEAEKKEQAHEELHQTWACVGADSDDELDAVTRMEIDMAVAYEMEKIKDLDEFRKRAKRKMKKKKIRRRELVMRAWANDLSATNASIEKQATQHYLNCIQDKDDDDEDDDDNEDEDLVMLRDFQSRSFDESIDNVALASLLDGPQVDVLESDNQHDQGALVPIGKTQDELRAEQRAQRWFSQDMFKCLSKGDDEGQLVVSKKDDSSEEGSADEDSIKEKDFSYLPPVPLSDREKRKRDRKKKMEYLERTGKKPKAKDMRGIEIVPLEPPKPLVPVKKMIEKPKDPQELAEIQAIGSILVESKKSRMDLIDAAYNRWCFNDDDVLPEWFTENENLYNKPELPVTRELVQQFRDKIKEINQRPIRKVVQAKARKRRRLVKKLEKMRNTATSLMDDPTMSATQKNREMRKMVSKLARDTKKKVSVVAIRKGGGGRAMVKGRRVPRGSKVKVVDKRLKNDIKSQKRAFERNTAKSKAKHRRKAKRTNAKRAQSQGSQGKGIYSNTA